MLATRGQRPDESLAEFLQALNVLAKDCVFKGVTAAQSKEEFIRDTFINGLSSSSIRRLLEHADLDLRKAIDLADSLDMAQKQSATYSSTELLYSASVETDRQKLDNLNHQVSRTRDPLLSHLLSRKIRIETINDFAFSVAVLGIIFEKLSCPRPRLHFMRD